MSYVIETVGFVGQYLNNVLARTQFNISTFRDVDCGLATNRLAVKQLCW
jgi:hypothetical protein